MFTKRQSGEVAVDWLSQSNSCQLLRWTCPRKQASIHIVILSRIMMYCVHIITQLVQSKQMAGSASPAPVNSQVEPVLTSIHIIIRYNVHSMLRSHYHTIGSIKARGWLTGSAGWLLSTPGLPMSSPQYISTSDYYIHLVEVEVDEVEIGQWCEQVFRWSLMVIIGGRPPDDILVTLP